MRYLLNGNEIPDLQKGTLKEYRFTPFIDFSESNLKRIYQSSHYLSGIKGEESKEDWKVFLERYMKIKSIEQKYQEKVEDREGKIENINIDNQTIIKEKDDLKNPIEFFQRSLKILEQDIFNSMNNYKEPENLLGQTKINNNMPDNNNDYEDYLRANKSFNNYSNEYHKNNSGKLPNIKKKYRVNLSILDKRSELVGWEISERRCKIMDNNLS